MESASDQLSPKPDLLVGAKQRVEAASDFLSFCDRISTGYDSGYYWEDVQRALRIAAGLEQWPDKGWGGNFNSSPAYNQSNLLPFSTDAVASSLIRWIYQTIH